MLMSVAYWHLVPQEPNCCKCDMDIGVLKSKVAAKFEHRHLNLSQLYNQHSRNIIVSIIIVIFVFVITKNCMSDL